MIEELLAGLARANVAAGAAVLLVMALRRPLRRAFGARAAYAAWSLVPLAALASLAPRPAEGTAISPIIVAAASAIGQAAPDGVGGEGLGPLLLGLWLAGALATAAVLARRQALFMASLGRLTPLPGQPGALRAEHSGVGPALVGAIRPRIVAPADFEARFAPAERDVILAHEAAHLACGDAPINALAAAGQCLAWFNPLVHLGVHVMRIDQELACDAAVLARFPAARRLYGEVLLKTQLATQPLPLGCHWPAGAEHPLKERIVMLKSPLPARPRRIAGLGVVAALSLGGAAAAWAAQTPTERPLVAQPDWAARPDGQDLARVYPPTALAERVEGRAVLGCEVAATGRLEACKVLMEDPPQYGFGDAALALAQTFQMRPMSRDGQPVAGGTVRIPILFRMPQPAA